MNGTFRQSMAWLHTWAGLVLGCVLYFMFVTGTAGYFDTEIDYWMRPEVDRARMELSTAHAIEIAQSRLEAEAPQAARWILYPPSGHDVAELSVFWRTLPDAAGAVESRSEVLDPTTGRPLEARDTGGGEALYQMHYLLHYLPSRWAYWIVGVATMFMLVAIVSGVITHKKIFRDFFTFRPRKGQRSWLDAHNVVSVIALPFHLMITYSGLIFFSFTYMPLVVAGSYGAGADNRNVFFAEVFQRGTAPERSGVAAPLASLERMATEVERRWGPDEIRSIDVQNPGDASARVSFTRNHVTPSSNGDRLAFDGTSGAVIESSATPRTGPMLVNDTMMSLHEGLFAGPVLRWLYFLSGLAGTVMVGTGLVYWTAKRRREGKAAHAGLAFVERLNVGTIVGLPAAIAVYFWANRLLPLDLEARAQWEIDVLFIAWGLLLVYPLLRPLKRAWIEELALAAALCALLPLVNALTTTRHLGHTLPAGDWVLAGFDLTLLAFGAAFGAVAWRLAQTTQRIAPRTAALTATSKAKRAVAEEAAV